jgi:hypothetical protein
MVLEYWWSSGHKFESYYFYLFDKNSLNFIVKLFFFIIILLVIYSGILNNNINFLV